MTVQQAFELALHHHQAGRLPEAETLYQQILATQPNHAEALHHLGVIAHQVGRNGLAVELMGKAIALLPNNPAAHSHLGEAYRAMGWLDDAIASFGQALELKPQHASTHYNLGNALRDRGQLDEAIVAFRQAIRFRTGYVEAYNNLGNVLRNRRQYDQAITAFRQAIALKPDYADAHNNLGAALKEKGELGEAIAALRRAVQCQPNHAEAYSNLGAALVEQGHLDEAIAAHRRALELKPDHAKCHNNLAIALAERGEIDEAAAAYRRALRLEPECAETYGNLGSVLREQGRLEDAVLAYRKALELNPNDAKAHSDLVLTLHFHPRYDSMAISEEQDRWNQRFGAPAMRRTRPHANDHNPERRLRVGYVSPDFRNHAVGWNLIPLFRCHDQRHFEILCYSGVKRPDGITGEFQKRAAYWRSTVGLEDEALAETIRQDEVDILVDLSQHTDGNRLPLFARKPAPVQVSFAGYPESTGVEAIKYRISDRWLECGRRKAELPTERVFFIDSFWCYDPCGVEVAVNELPASESGKVTFGSLNNFSKVNEPLLKLWARVLRATPDARLVMLSGVGSHRQRTLEFLEREGIAAGRVEFMEPRPRRAYLELYRRLDMVLDTFPYNGHTTSLDALWMGVPVVSLYGERPVSRAGLSQLTNLGLPELVAHTEEEYVEIATRLAHDLPRLAELRRTLRKRMESSVLMDAPRFARSIETAYRAMWRHWCAKETGER